MENDRFDALTRALSTTDSRRRTLRALGGTLLGGVLGGAAASLGLGEDAAAKGKKHQKEHKDHKRSGQGQAAGKHHKKHKRKDKDKHKDHDKKPIPPLPPGCEHCTECQMCQDGACVPDQDLAGVPCLGGGAACNYCQNGVCKATEQLPCDDGVCARRGYCCPGEKYCSDRGSSTGFACVGVTDCCPDRKKCANGSCIPRTRCCPGEKQCAEGGPCWPMNHCCLNTKPTCGDCEDAVCNAGHWICVSSCTADGDACCGGSCKSTTCPPGQEFDSETCTCKPVGICPNGSPDDCSVYFGDHCATHPSYFCMRGVAGNSECVQALYPYQVYCQADADCDWIWGPGVGMCGLCKHQCYHKYLE
jgi:hypothetical protein